MADCPQGFEKNPLTGECVPKFTAKEDTGSALGGIDPNYKMPYDLNKPWGTVDTPHAFTTNDINIIYKISTDKLTSYQTQLMAAFPGYKPTLGNRADSKLKSVFSKALTQINLLNSDPTSPLRGKSLDEALAYLAKNPVGSLGGSGLPTFRLNDPDTLKKAFEGGAQSALGRTLSPEDMNKLVNSFNQLDMDYQRAAAGGGGGTITQAPNAEVFAETQAEKMAPVEAESYDYMNYMGALSKWMQG
jgi:hypothetical protein